jgi:Ca2+-binding RTX toxin-like protein
MLRTLAAAIAMLAIAAPAAAAHGSDAEIFATSNTALITDSKDPRLNARLTGFAHRVEDIIRDGGARPRGSELLDGVFVDAGSPTFERSRRFDVDRTDPQELHDIAETIRRRFLQGSVLTFTPRSGGAAIELDVPHVSAKALRTGLLANPEAQERLFGGSVTEDDHLLLVADAADADFARAFAQKIGGDVKRATTTYGDREFVSAATDGRARLEHRTLVLAGTDEDDTIGLRDGRRLEIDFGDDGVVDFEVSHRRFKRIRVDGEGQDTIVLHGSSKADRFDLSAGDYDGAEVIRVDAQGGDDEVTVDDLSATSTFEVDTDLGAGEDRLTVNSTNDDEQSLILGFDDTVFVLAATFVQVDHAETQDRLRLNARRGDDLLSTSSAQMKMTIDGGDGGDTIFGGPGPDTLIGGDDFDLVEGKQGDDVAYLGGDNDSFTWKPGDGNDRVDGGSGARNGMFFFGSNDAETFDFRPDGHRLKLTRDVGNIVMDIDDVQTFDLIAFGGADVTRIADLRPAGVTEINASLTPNLGLGTGDGAADRVEIDGTNKRDVVTVTGQTVVSGAATVTGLPVKLGISHSDGLLDTLAIHTLAGDDTVDTSGLQPNTIGLVVD